MVYGTIFYGKDLGWWFDVAGVMDKHDIKDADLLDKLLRSRHPWRVPNSRIKDAQELEERLDQTQNLSFSIPSPLPIIDAKSRDTKLWLSEILGQPDPPKLPRPTIGRIVHYITKDGNELPAIIVAISSFTPDQWVYLKAFVWSNYKEDLSDFAIQNEENKKAVRTWHWPEREA